VFNEADENLQTFDENFELCAVEARSVFRGDLVRAGVLGSASLDLERRPALGGLSTDAIRLLDFGVIVEPTDARARLPGHVHLDEDGTADHQRERRTHRSVVRDLWR